MTRIRLIALLAGLLALTGSCTAQSEMKWQFSAANQFVSAHGRRAWAGGYANRGLEIWAGALQIASEVQPEFRRAGDVTILNATQTLADVIVLPDRLSRTYTGPDFAIREDIRVAPDREAVLIHYTVQSVAPVQVIVRFCPSLNLMWPAAIGGQSVRWEDSQSAYILSEPSRKFAAVALAPGATAHDEPLNNATAQANEFRIALDLHSPRILFARLSGGSAETPSSSELEDLQQLLRPSAMNAEDLIRNKDLLASDVEIETPDPDLNRALAWAEINLDQAWLCNEQLGCGFVAGFGPSRRSRRPQYAWYFAGDGMIASHAAMEVGDLLRTRNELNFISKYQRSDGMIWHEISQSAPYLDWQNEYPYMFVHADLTYPYISSVADYVRRSNDRALLHEIWPSLQKAFEFGVSLVGSDGLPRIPARTLGADEQGALADELGLSATWIAACQDYAFLSELMSDKDAELNATRLAGRARASFPQHYWDVREDAPLHGYTRAGTPVPDHGLSAVEAIESHLFSDAQIRQMLDNLSSWRFQADWGTRGLPVGDSAYDPTGYVHGSVSGLRTAKVAQLFWAQHRPDAAFQIWHALVPWFGLDSPGHMHEVLQGNVYMPQSESVPEQTWSSAGFLSAAVEGLFGLEIKGDSRQVALAPHLPSSWDHAALRNVPVGNGRITFSFEQNINALTVRVENGGEPVHLLYSPQIPLGARHLIATQDKRTLAARITTHEQDMHAELQTEVPHGNSEIILRYQDGISLVLPPAHPIIGEPSSGMKITSVLLSGDVLRLGIDLVPDQNNKFEIRTSRAIRDVRDAIFQWLSAGKYAVSFRSANSKSPGTYQHHEIVIQFAPEKRLHASSSSTRHVSECLYEYARLYRTTNQNPS